MFGFVFINFLAKIFIFGFISSETLIGEERKKQFKLTVASTPAVEGEVTPAKSMDTILSSIEK